ncbi:MAG TPA: hypothetical protein DDY78_30095 [Planctomycetales bacterium]|nr:hypothetical protein [Planctomycetales bacterium]
MPSLKTWELLMTYLFSLRTAGSVVSPTSGVSSKNWQAGFLLIQATWSRSRWCYAQVFFEGLFGG